MGNSCLHALGGAAPAISFNPDSVDLSHYESLKTLGRGGQGTVIVCKNRVTGQLVAIKCMTKKTLLKHPNYLATLYNERHLLILNTVTAAAQQASNAVVNNETEGSTDAVPAAASTPQGAAAAGSVFGQLAQSTIHSTSHQRHTDISFLCTVHHCFQSATHLYLVLPFYAGGDLRYHLTAQHRFDERTARFYAAQLLLAMAALHSNHILYRDLKPENLLLDHRGNLVLCDFGLACQLRKSDGYATMGRSGTLAYFSPEMLMNQVYSFEVDYWSYGCVCYELLHGQRPLRLRDIQQYLQPHRRAPPTPEEIQEMVDEIHFSNHISSAARDFLRQLLKVHKAERLGYKAIADQLNGLREQQVRAKRNSEHRNAPVALPHIQNAANANLLLSQLSEVAVPPFEQEPDTPVNDQLEPQPSERAPDVATASIADEFDAGSGWRSMMEHPWFKDHVDWSEIVTKHAKPRIRPKKNVVHFNAKYELEAQLVTEREGSSKHIIPATKQKYFRHWPWNDQVGAASSGKSVVTGIDQAQEAVVELQMDTVQTQIDAMGAAAPAKRPSAEDVQLPNVILSESMQHEPLQSDQQVLQPRLTRPRQ